MIINSFSIAKIIFLFLYFGVSFFSSIHALTYKRDSRSALGWFVLIWLSPFIGAFLYLLFGINRIRRKALSLRPSSLESIQIIQNYSSEVLEKISPHLVPIKNVGDRIGLKPLLEKSEIDCLKDGDEVYPEMLQSISAAKKTLFLSTYIFDYDEVGEIFVNEIEKAMKRGVCVRVLVDDIGSRYSRTSIVKILRKRKIRVAKFLPVFSIQYTPSLHLRNHRKILVVDSEIGFTGGMNIRVGNALKRNPKYPVKDLHFKIKGPMVSDLEKVFIDDWEFATGEKLKSTIENVSVNSGALSRVIPDGPDANFERTRWLLLGAISSCRKNIRIMAPYFLPDNTLMTALCSASLRGVSVTILIPEKNNLPWFTWATKAMLWQLLEKDCEVFMTPPPFDHSKLTLMDDAWVLFGSSNWDTRSFRLNFELNVECYDPSFASELIELFESRKNKARKMTLKDVDARPYYERARDGIARLFSPYL